MSKKDKLDELLGRPSSSNKEDLYETMTNFIKTQNEFLKTQQATQQILNNTFEHLQNSNGDLNDGTILGAPRARSHDPEFLIESLSTVMTEFTFDLECNSTFGNWYSRYNDLFSEDANNLSDSAKSRLLLRKLDTPAHTKFVNYILPKQPVDYTFDEIVEMRGSTIVLHGH